MAILTISRQIGSGGTDIGHKVADHMGFEYVDRERILEDLRKVGPKWEEWAKELDEHCPTIWERNDWSFRGFTALVQSTILEYATRDKVVIMGRGSNFLLEGIRCAYRVRITAPLDLRVGRVASRENINLSTARWIVEKTDAERSCFIQSIYGKHVDESSAYDDIFDVRYKMIDDIVHLLIKALNEREQFNTEEVKQLLRMRTAAARVKAGIATNPRFFVPILDVTVEGNSLVVRGVIHSAKEYRRVEEETAKLAGSIPIRCELHHRL